EQYGKGIKGEGGIQSLAGEDESEPEKADGGNGHAKADDGNGAGGNGAAPSLDDSDGGTLPEFAEGEELSIVTPPGVIAEQKFTQPPPRYNEGSLVRELEKRGIGRP